MKHNPKRSIIVGTGHYLPDRVVTSEEIETKMKLQLDFVFPRGSIENLCGVKERRYVANDFHPSDAAYEASEMALEQAGVKPKELDVIVFGACTKDIAEPATANILQEKLKASNASVFDTQNACNSFVNALDVVDSLIRTGKCGTALVATGEVLSPFINWDLNTRKDMETGFAGLTLGDGGGAVVVKGTNDCNKGIQATYFESAGALWELATVMGGGTVAPRDVQASYFNSESKRLLRFAYQTIPKVIKTFSKENKVNLQEIDLVFAHQASEGIIKKVCKALEFPYERCQNGLKYYGNTGAASIPISLSLANTKGLLKPGQKILLVGGAAGFSTGIISLIW
jgi:3-oxoacyl-[acyl-carrier-protein] synthase-3